MANKEPVFWTTKDGRMLNVDDMDENHIKNAFKLLICKLEAIRKSAIKQGNSVHFQLNGEMAIASITDSEDEDNYDPYSEDYLWE
jgi:hypothetical protein